MDSEEYKFGGVEYGVFSAVLVLSAGIGVYYGFIGSRQKSTEEFLMASRQMGALPVALSLVCSFVSAVTILGNPAEVYLYGTQYAMIVIAFIPLTLVLMYLYVPVFFQLQVSSAYEYLEMRFSKHARVLMSFLSLFHTTLYMAVVVYGPSLALQQVTGIDTKLSTGLIFLVCIFYSSLGGLKAVLWTDALQAVVMLGSLIVVVIMGFSEVGGMAEVWERADNSSRLNFFNFDPDPRTRHTFWTATIGGFFMWLPMYAGTQQQVQRYLSVPSLASCRRALWINMLGLYIVTLLWFFCGLVIYAKYYDCDPINSKLVTSQDQLLPQFVMETSGGIKGLPGLFVAGVTCASLSTVSSGLNAVASIVTFDYLKRLAPHLTDDRLSTISKFVSIIFGAVSYGCVFIAENMEGLATASNSLHGLIIGPSLGLFTLGMFFPWANTKGSILGVISATLVLLLQVIDNNVANTKKLLPDQTLFLTTRGCNSSRTDIILQDYPAQDWKNQGDDGLIQIASMSYTWQPAIASVLTVVFGVLFSLAFSHFENKRESVRADLLSPPLLALYKKVCPKHIAKWVHYSDNSNKEKEKFEEDGGHEQNDNGDDKTK